MRYSAFISSSVSAPNRRKVHISDDGTGESLCGIERRCPWILFSATSFYSDIEGQFFVDPDGEGCKDCGARYRKSVVAALTAGAETEEHTK